MRICKTTGYVIMESNSSVSALSNVQDAESVINGSNASRSTRGRRYRTDDNPYLVAIRLSLLEDLALRGLFVHGVYYQVAENVCEQLCNVGDYADILPDDLYDAIFFGRSNGQRYQNPNTGLCVQVEDGVITRVELLPQEKKPVDTAAAKGYYKKHSNGYVEKGGGSAYHSETGKVLEKLKEISERNSIDNFKHLKDQNKWYRCAETADEMQQYLQSLGLHGRRYAIEIKSKNGFIGTQGYHNWGETISLNGKHYGIEYDGRVYDNVYPEGLPTQEWLSAFDGIGERVTPDAYSDF